VELESTSVASCPHGGRDREKDCADG
jgi:hypothetical protein